jgi:hypothetical protein
MNLVKYNASLETNREFPGLFSCKFKHEIKETKAEFRWLGPRIDPKEWAQTLSFFKWTYDTTKSESQVRWFCHPQKGVWQPWAFPQEARTGMSAREIHPHPLLEEQRKLFLPEDGWLYSSTGHHHCNATAFQSSVDEANERNQDGLHYTIGSLDNKFRYDIHCRFYLNGAQFDPDMSLFWDIGDQARGMFPMDLWNRIARWQMCQPVTVDFPETWRTNVIEVKPVAVTTAGGGYFSSGRFESDGIYHGSSYASGAWGENPKQRAARCAREIISEVAESSATFDDFLEFIASMKVWTAACDKSGISDLVWTHMKYFRVEFYDDLLNALPSARKMAKLYNHAAKKRNFGEVPVPELAKGEVDDPEDVSTPTVEPKTGDTSPDTNDPYNYEMGE